MSNSYLTDSSDDDEEDAMMATTAISNVQTRVRQRIRQRAQETTTRNVLLVGRTRAGKTTFRHVVQDVTHVPSEASLFSNTKDAKRTSISIEDFQEGRPSLHYTLNIVDTPGLFEVTRASDETKERSNKIIQQCIGILEASQARDQRQHYVWQYGHLQQLDPDFADDFEKGNHLAEEKTDQHTQAEAEKDHR